MNIQLSKATVNDAKLIYTMQKDAFMALYEKYKDDRTSPVKETLEKVQARLAKESGDTYIIYADATPVGAIRIEKRNAPTYRISPVFVVPAYQGQGIAKRVLQLIEQMYDAEKWTLETIFEERGLCAFYENLGYKPLKDRFVISPEMTLVSFEKRMEGL